MHYEQWGWFWLIIGFLGVGFGSVISTFGWNWQGNKEKKKYVWAFLVTAGLLVAGFGGIFSTWGWDNINKQGQKEALIFALAREWNINKAYVNTPPLKFEPNAENIGVKHDAFPRFETSVVINILTSNLFNDATFIDLIFNYRASSRVCNTFFEISDEQLTRPAATPEKRAEEYIKTNTIFRPLKHFKAYHVELGKILKTKYKKQYDEALEFAYKDDSPQVAKPKENG